MVVLTKPYRDQAIEQYAAGALAALDALGIGDAAVDSQAHGRLREGIG